MKTIIMGCAFGLSALNQGAAQTTPPSSAPGSAPAPDGAYVLKEPAATPADLGYRPLEGEKVFNTPPSLVWLNDPPAISYEVQWAQNEDFKDAVTISDVIYNAYTHSAPLPAGKYFWRYRALNAQKAASNWSKKRSFHVPPNAVRNSIPTRAQQKERVPREHPRLLMRPENLGKLKELAKGTEAESFSAVLVSAQKIMKEKPAPEPKDKSQGWNNFMVIQRTARECEILAFAHLITGEQRYADAARQWLLNFASWDPAGCTNYRSLHYGSSGTLYGISRAYDWLYPVLTAEERETVKKTMKQRGDEVLSLMKKGKGIVDIGGSFESHENIAYSMLGEAGIAFFGEIEGADLWLDGVLNKFVAAYPPWGDSDGGWHEGHKYWACYMSCVHWWLLAQREALGVEAFKKEYFLHSLDYALYVVPPGAPHSGMGDLCFGAGSAMNVEGRGNIFIDYFLRAAGRQPGNHAAYWRWWADGWKFKADSPVYAFLNRAVTGPLPEPKAPTDIPQSKVFRGIGIASMHYDLANAANDVHILFKSSPFGTISHGNTPQNAFSLDAYGEPLLVDISYRDGWATPFHSKWVWETRSHNAVLVHGKGQPARSPIGTGEIVDWQFGREVDYVVGDATHAYPGILKRFRRHILFVKPRFVVIYDDLVPSTSSTFQWELHSLKPIQFDERTSRLSVEQPQAGVEVQYVTDLPLDYLQWDGYDPAPREGDGTLPVVNGKHVCPNQWHSEATSKEPQAAMNMLMVLVPHRNGARPEWKAQRVESDTAVGLKMELAGKSYNVGFRKYGVQGNVTLQDFKFDGNWGVK